MAITELTKAVNDLYLDRILETNPELTLDEGYDLARGYREPVDMYFGSSGYTVSLANVLSGESQSIFINGYCGLLAHQISNTIETDRFLLVTTRENNPFHVSGEWNGHVLAESDRPGFWIDFTGEHTEDSVKSDYNPDSYTMQIINRDEFTKTVIGEKHQADPMGFLEPLEQAFTNMVTEAVLDRVKRARS